MPAVAVATRTAVAPAVAPAPAPAAVAPAPAFAARRPLIAASGGLAGFEFRLARPLEHRLRSRPDAAAQAAYIVALFAAMRPALDSGRIALARVPGAALAREAVVDAVPAGSMLIVADPAADDGAQRAGLARMRERGAKIGLRSGVDDMPRIDELGGDFVVLEASGVDIDAVIASARRWKHASPGAMLVAADVDNVDDLEQVLRNGFAFATADFGRAAEASKAQSMQTTAHRIIGLLNDLAQNAETAPIAERLRADVALSYHLLRYANSAALGLREGVDSVDRAVALLGRNELYRWLSVLLLASANAREASRALHEIALARARLLESLARERGVDPPQALFTVGLMSLLDVILQMPLADAIAPLRLGKAASDALLERSGPWHRYLALAVDLERHDLAAAAAHCEAFGGLSRVLELSDDAWRWAEAVHNETRAHDSDAQAIAR